MTRGFVKVEVNSPKLWLPKDARPRVTLCNVSTPNRTELVMLNTSQLIRKAWGSVIFQVSARPASIPK
jgi:hypothetical protein